MEVEVFKGFSLMCAVENNEFYTTMEFLFLGYLERSLNLTPKSFITMQNGCLYTTDVEGNYFSL